MGKRSALMLKRLQFLPAKLVKPLAQSDDGGHHALGEQFATEAFGFRSDNDLSVGSSGFAFATVVLHDTLKIVDIIEENARDFANSGIDVTRNGDVDQAKRSSVALASDDFSFIADENSVRAGSRADDDVRFDKLLPAFFEGDGDAPQIGR